VVGRRGVAHGLEFAIGFIGRNAALGPIAEISFVTLELVDHALEGCGLTVGFVLCGGALLCVGVLGHLEERILQQLLRDAILQIERRELQDLHGLNHLRRLDESLLHSGRL